MVGSGVVAVSRVGVGVGEGVKVGVQVGIGVGMAVGDRGDHRQWPHGEQPGQHAASDHEQQAQSGDSGDPAPAAAGCGSLRPLARPLERGLSGGIVWDVDQRALCVGQAGPRVSIQPCQPEQGSDAIGIEAQRLLERAPGLILPARAGRYLALFKQGGNTVVHHHSVSRSVSSCGVRTLMGTYRAPG
jgi:hypothetical protein